MRTRTCDILDRPRPSPSHADFDTHYLSRVSVEGRLRGPRQGLALGRKLCSVLSVPESSQVLGWRMTQALERNSLIQQPCAQEAERKRPRRVPPLARAPTMPSASV